LLKTTVSVLQTLVREYHVSVVLCTATQPAVDRTPYLRGFDEMPIREIVPQYAAHFRALKRVEYERRAAPVSTGELAAEILGLPQEQVLVILNTRRDAMELLSALRGAAHVYHLSTLLCGAHRKAVLEEIRLRLDPEHPLPVRLISTQVVEAGVDIDFPVVYRAMAPLDRIVQAAGRCNREGKLPGLGRVVLFQPEAGGMPRGAYKAGFELANLLLGRNSAERLQDPELYQEYFRGLYSYVDTDKRKIEPDRVALDYPEVARKYRLIDDDTVAVVVRYGDSAARLADWERWPSREAWRALQPFIVNLYRFEAARFESEGWLQPLADGLYVWLGKYDAVRGIEPASLDPADLYVGEDRRRS
jgi:CRISPR-associated endonuclease/helicase Cas3